MNVSNQLKQKFIERDGAKIVTLSFPSLGLNISNENIYADTLEIKESILEGSSIEFVGCISSTMSVELHGITAQLKGQRIIAYVTIQGFESEQIPIFRGYVDSVKTRLSDSYKSIVCYDDLYYKASDKDIASWYKGLSFPITIKDFRDRLFSYIGITQEQTVLPNDSIEIDRQYQPSSMNALSTIKSICQMNGVFGIMNRDGLFDYKRLSIDIQGTFPATYTFPSVSLFPTNVVVPRSTNGDSSTTVSYYKEMMYEDFDVYAITKVIVRDNEDDAGQSYGSGTNSYIVQGNMFIYGLSDAVKTRVATNIYANVQGFSYIPFESESIGLPWIECGDIVEYNIADYSGTSPTYVKKTFYVLSRSMKGIQELFDNYSADGEQYQKTFISDLKTKLDSLQTKVNSAATIAQVKDYVDGYTYPKSEWDLLVDRKISDEINKMETPTGFTVVSCYNLPSSRDANTIYLVQSDVVIVR